MDYCNVFSKNGSYKKMKLSLGDIEVINRLYPQDTDLDESSDKRGLYLER